MSSQIRNFLIAFVVAAVVFSAIAVVAVDIIDTKVLNPGKGDNDGVATVTPPAPPDDTQTNNNDDIYRGSGTTFNFLLIGTDEEIALDDGFADAVLKPQSKNKAIVLIFAMYNKEKNEFVVSPIPNETIISVDGVSMSIGDAYNYKDERYIAEKVSVLIGIAVDYYMSVPITEFGSFVNYVGGVECDIPTDIIFYDDRQEVNIELNRGKQYIDGASMVGLLRYNGYTNNIQKMTLATDAFMSAMHKITSDYLNKQQYATLFAFFTQNMKTNFTFDVMKSNVELVFKFTGMTKSYIMYPGYWSDNQFIPEVDKGNQQFSVYR